MQGQLESRGEKTTLGFHFISYSKINFRWTKELNIKTKTIRNLEHINNYTLSWENHLNIVEEITKRKIGGFEYTERVFKMINSMGGGGGGEAGRGTAQREEEKTYNQYNI